MADVTITRGIGFRDDFLVTTTSTTGHTTNVTSALTTDGDVGSNTVVFTSAVTGNAGGLFQAGLSLATNTYPYIQFKGSFGLAANIVGEIYVTYSDATTQTFTLNGATATPQTFSLTAGKTVTQVNSQFRATGSVSSA